MNQSRQPTIYNPYRGNKPPRIKPTPPKTPIDHLISVVESVEWSDITLTSEYDVEVSGVYEGHLYTWQLQNRHHWQDGIRTDLHFINERNDTIRTFVAGRGRLSNAEMREWMARFLDDPRTAFTLINL